MDTFYGMERLFVGPSLWQTRPNGGPGNSKMEIRSFKMEPGSLRMQPWGLSVPTMVEKLERCITNTLC